MDKFKKMLIRRFELLGGCAAVYIAANILLYATVGVKGAGYASDFIRGFHFGAGLFLLFLLGRWILQYGSALRSEEKLRKLYIAENDERSKMIRQRSGSTGMRFAIFGLSGAAVLAGYINATVFFTLLGAGLYVALTHAALKYYFKKKL